ncbi:MAG TPA: LysM domain-containing protein [Planctomycetota bacterium]|nr:LysM domain-containing protein [Planctomycetota bacterium]
MTIVSTLAVAAVGLHLFLGQESATQASPPPGWGQLLIGRPSGAPPVASQPQGEVATPVPPPPLQHLPTPSLPGVADAADPALERAHQPVFQVTVSPGDTLGELCQGFYGTARPALVAAVAEFNGLSGPDRIRVGQVLHLPPLADLEQPAD